MPTAAATATTRAIMLMIIWNNNGKKPCWIQNLSNLMHLALNYKYKLSK